MVFRRLISKGDKSIIHAFLNNPSATIAGAVWIFKWFRGESDPRTLEILADYLILHDSKDIGQFDHMHHWITGYILKSLSQSRQLPPNQRKAKIIQDLVNISNARRRLKFIGDK